MRGTLRNFRGSRAGVNAQRIAANAQRIAANAARSIRSESIINYQLCQANFYRPDYRGPRILARRFWALVRGPRPGMFNWLTQ
jgi:hypothetical protein